ncbi:MAG: adenylate/guanylate cyclase domain-containing protein [Dehalococcoidales bacterium]|jgi:adenylate cyclase
MSAKTGTSKKTVNRRQSKWRSHIAALLAVGLVFILFTTFVQPFASVQLWLTDQLFTAEAPSPNIVVIGIDDATLQTYGKWSDWSRDLHAQAINNLSAAGAKVIGYDVLFVDASAHDTQLAAAIANAGNVVLPVVGSRAVPLIDSTITYDYFLAPVPAFWNVIAATGHANIIPDRDGKVRRLPLIARDESGNVFPSFSLAMLHTLFNMPFPEEYVRENGALHLLARDVPVDEKYQLRINFSAEGEDRPYLSYGDVISGSFDPQVVNNKIVVIGMTATGDVDAWGIPTSAVKVPGVYIHAATMDTILRSLFLTEAGNLTTLWIMLLLLVITALALPFIKLKWGGLLTAGLFIGYLVISFFAFDRGHILNLLYPPIMLIFVYITSIIAMIIYAQSDKRFVKDLFGRYVSPQVADQILNLADSGTLQLGGERRQTTILFADIRGFTKMSEQMSPEEIVHMLNTYLSVMIDKVLANSGMVNKFAGDNIMAVWNAPQAQAEHARLAAKAAWEAQQAISEMQAKDASLPRVQFGIGINTGDVLAGNVGSSGRTEYTVIGDAVNLASRICSATPGTEVWLGPETYRQIKDHIEATPLEPQAFKGKAESVVVYHLTGWK